MKKSIRIIVLLMCLMLSGCCGGDEIMIKSTFYGGVTVTPLDVNNGDAITLKMGEFCGVISTAETLLNPLRILLMEKRLCRLLTRMLIMSPHTSLKT